jgi:two-component SAPR family response regulator
MLFHTVTHLSLESFRQRSKGKKIVLIYPWTNYRNLFLTYFFEDPTEGLLYFRIRGERLTLYSWLTDLRDEFASTLANFGEQLNQILDKGKPAEIGEAFAADLGSYAQEQLVLFIDELDRVVMDDHFNEFIRALVSALPDNVQIAFSSRLLTYQPWYDMVARNEAIVLGTDQRKNDMMFTVEAQPKPQLEVYGFGRGHALANGMPITNWDGALPRNLFFFFMDHPLITRDEIFEIFWPDLSVKDATNVFHVTKRKITERISLKITSDGNYELTQYNSEFYMPSEKIIRHYDVGDFQEAVDKALVAGSEKEEIILLSRAIDIYRAPFLQTVDMEWVRQRRDNLRQLYAQALINLGRISQRHDENQQAIGYFTRALKETPEREDIHRQVMSLYQKLGLHDDAINQYLKLQMILQERLKIAPSRETRELYERIAETDA